MLFRPRLLRASHVLLSPRVPLSKKKNNNNNNNGKIEDNLAIKGDG